MEIKDINISCFREERVPDSLEITKSNYSKNGI